MDSAVTAATAKTINRTPYAGGVPQVAMKGKFKNICCPRAPAKECVVEELDEEHRQSAFEAYNVKDNTTRKLFTLPLPNSKGLWKISPDGSRLAMLQPHSPQRYDSDTFARRNTGA